MAENTGRGMGASQNFLQVSSANTAGMHAYEQLSLADFRDRDYLQADIVLTVIDSSLHCPAGSEPAFG